MAAGRRPIAGSSSTARPVGAGLDHEERRADALGLGGDEEELAVSAARASSDLAPSRTQSSPSLRAVVSSFSGSNSGRGSRIASAAAGVSSPVKAGR